MSVPNMPPGTDEAVQRIKELNDRMIEMARKNGLTWLQAYENVLNTMLQLQQRAAAATQMEWINALTTAMPTSCGKCRPPTSAQFANR